MAVAEKAATYFGILTLIIFANNAEIDFTRFKVLDRSFNAFQQLYGAQVDVLTEGPPDGNQQPPQRNMIGDSRVSVSSQINGVEGAKLFKAICGHHAPGL